MANFKTPNLCGANPDLNEALSKIDDLKNINYKRLFYDIRNSQYLKPSVGIFSASLLTILLLVPAIETINSSLKKAKKYKLESKNKELTFNRTVTLRDTWKSKS